MRIATWNVNSIRSRIDRVEAWLERSDVDVLAIQETKAREDQFPLDRFEALGYEVAHHGLNQWNGVAIASRVGLDDVQVGFDGMPGWGEPVGAEARAIGATLRRRTGLVALRPQRPRARRPAPGLQARAGSARLPRPAGSWLADDPAAQIALLGDWNIAPHDEDVWSVEYYEGQARTPPPASAPPSRASSTPASATSCAPTRASPAPSPTGTTRSCASRSARACGSTSRSCSPALADRVVGAAIDREERKGKGASDHAPVVFQVGE